MSNAYGKFYEQYAVFNQVGSIFHNGVIHSLREGQESSGAKDAFNPISPRYGDQLSGHFRQMMNVSAVDNFNSFLSDLVVEILNKDPRPIQGKNFPVKDIFSFSNIEELKKAVIEKFISELGYQNVDDLVTFLENNFGLYALSHWLTKLRLRRAIQIRNIITHNRGVVNRIYLLRSQSKIDIEGKPVLTRHPVRIAAYTKALVELLDKEATDKFDLEQSVKIFPVGFGDHLV